MPYVIQVKKFSSFLYFPKCKFLTILHPLMQFNESGYIFKYFEIIFSFVRLLILPSCFNSFLLRINTELFFSLEIGILNLINLKKNNRQNGGFELFIWQLFRPKYDGGKTAKYKFNCKLKIGQHIALEVRPNGDETKELVQLLVVYRLVHTIPFQAISVFQLTIKDNSSCRRNVCVHRTALFPIPYSLFIWCAWRAKERKKKKYCQVAIDLTSKMWPAKRKSRSGSWDGTWCNFSTIHLLNARLVLLSPDPAAKATKILRRGLERGKAASVKTRNKCIKVARKRSIRIAHTTRVCMEQCRRWSYSMNTAILPTPKCSAFVCVFFLLTKTFSYTLTKPCKNRSVQRIIIEPIREKIGKRKREQERNGKRNAHTQTHGWTFEFENPWFPLQKLIEACRKNCFRANSFPIERHKRRKEGKKISLLLLLLRSEWNKNVQ